MKMRLLFLAALLTATPSVRADDLPLPDGTAAATKQMASFRHPAGMKVELWAAAPLRATPRAFCIDEKGRIFVAEEYRFNQGTEENRTRPFLLDDDLQLQTVDDRLTMYRKWAGKFTGGMDWFSKHSDQVRLLEDRSGHGKADFSTVFAGGFNGPLDGLAAGIIARDGNVYLTCIPHLWLLKDTKGTGKADVRVPLHRGFGVNCAFLGHDLHGLTWGPDGKLYFSVGDRGFHVVTKEGKTLHGPRTGGVFRCNPDGTELEVVHRGLRNPQELAFDQYGNLFAADNNCDKGDDSRLVYIVEDGDSGWNMSYQTIPEPYLTGPWHAERMWHLPNPGQPAWIVPPVGKLGAGPSGFTFTSGLSLPDHYRNKFFYCNYTGNGGVESFGVVPRGAGFAMVDHHDFLKPIMATDVDFGYDGKMYVSDFVNLLWDGGSAGGRIYTVFDPQRINDPAIREVKDLFADGFTQRSDAQLTRLLAHPDLKVRQRAQFTLAERGEKSIRLFHRVATVSDNQLARLHAIWGLGQIARGRPEVCLELAPLLKDQDAEVRAQAAHVIGDRRWNGATAQLVSMLTDASPRVRFFAAMALGKLRYGPAVEPIVMMLKENSDQDRFLRHAGVTALAWIGAADAMAARVRDESPAVRMAALLTLRRLNDRRVAQFLDDAELPIVTEAARAVHDLPMVEEMPAVARLLDRHASNVSPDAEPLLRRAIDAHFRSGQPDDAEALARFVSSERASATMRAEALAALADWVNPSPRDRVTGFWRPLPQRDAKVIRAVLEGQVPAILAHSSGKLQTDAVQMIRKLDIATDDRTIYAWAIDPKREPGLRVAALQLLATHKFPELEKALDAALTDASPRLRAESRTLLAAAKPTRALPLLEQVLTDGSADVVERQQALAALPKIAGAGKVLDEWAMKLSKNQVPPALQLDLLDALRATPTAASKRAVDQWEASAGPNPVMGKFRAALHGGDAERGRALFVGHAAAQCMRCHKVQGAGGDAGPDLTKVVDRNPKHTREYLLESLLLPSAKIAPGYGSVALTLTNGKVVGGLLKAEDGRSVTLALPDGSIRVVPKEEIDERTPPSSAMPEMGKVLTTREVRDLIEYLMTLK